jgi:macrolide-specific efflux system membrane fusion protein
LIDVKNEGRHLMTGMTAQVFFIFGKAENATIIPAEALTRPVPGEDNELGKAYRVSVATASGREQRLIRIGLQTRTQAEVKDGLQVGERILVNRPQSSTAPASSQPRASANRFNRGPQL